MALLVWRLCLTQITDLNSVNWLVWSVEGFLDKFIVCFESLPADRTILCILTTNQKGGVLYGSVNGHVLSSTKVSINPKQQCVLECNLSLKLQTLKKLTRSKHTAKREKEAQ